MCIYAYIGVEGGLGASGEARGGLMIANCKQKAANSKQHGLWTMDDLRKKFREWEMATEIKRERHF